MSRFILLVALLFGSACQSAGSHRDGEAQDAELRTVAFHVAGMMKAKSGAT